jgi:Holliday junction resolvase
MTNVRSKGKTWEREICKILSEHLGDTFIRVPNSGAYVGGNNFNRFAGLSNNQQQLMQGDIIPPEKYNKLIIEAKNYKDIALHKILSGKDCQQLNNWIDQTYFNITDKYAFLIFKITCKILENLFIKLKNIISFFFS